MPSISVQFCCTAVLFLTVVLQAQNFRFRHISVDNGLSQADVRVMAQDSSGFLWFATQDGLNRFDGNSFRIFRNDPTDTTSASANFLTALTTDKYGNIWVGSDGGGLCRYNPRDGFFRRFHSFTGNNSLQSNLVTALYPAQDGKLWIGTYRGGLSIYNPSDDSFTNILGNSKFPAINKLTTVSVITPDSRGNIWLGTLYDGLYCFNISSGKAEIFTTFNNNLPGNYVTALTEDKSGNMWVGTNLGLTVISTAGKVLNTFFHSSSPVSLSNNYVTALFCDNTGRIWVGTEDGLNLYNAKSNSFYSMYKIAGNNNSIQDNQIKCILQDKSGLLWFGTKTTGAAMLLPEQNSFGGLNKLNINSSLLSDKAVLSVLEDSDNNLWFGTDHGFYLFNRNTSTVKSFPEGINRANNPAPFYTWAIIEDVKTGIWAATNEGIYNYNKRTGKLSHYLNTLFEEQLLTNTFRSLCLQNDTLLWAGSYGKGLQCFNISTKKFIEVKTDNDEILRNVTIDCMYADKNGVLWLGTTAGLCSLSADRKKAHFYFTDRRGHALPTDECISIVPAGNNDLWLGLFGGGLVKFNPEKGIVKRFTINNGLANNSILSILKSEDSVIWLGTLNGISRVTLSNNLIENFSISNGIPDISPWVNSAAITKNNLFIFGFSGSICAFYPDSVLKRGFQAPPVITRLYISNKPDNRFGDLISGGMITVPYSENTLAFEYAGLDYTNPQAIRYRYLLTGIDNGPVEAGERRFASYNNIPPGSYRLFIWCTNADGVWGKTPLELSVIINPPFYATWWFRLLLIAAIVTSVYSVYKYRIRQLEKENILQQNFSRQLVESQDAERKYIASELHDGLGQNLLIINNRARMALKADNPEAVGKQVNLISEMALEAINDVRNIARHLHPYQLEEIGLTKTLALLIERISATTDITFRTELANVDSRLSTEISINIYRIIQEALNNILKYSRATEVSVLIKSSENGIIVSVADNGIGLSPEELKNNLSGVKGFGMKSMAERAKAMNAGFTVDSEKNKGTEIIVRINPEQNK